ncbi:MAG: hypothetical protein ACPG85_07670, partial [Flavobacteriales bacterium]
VYSKVDAEAGGDGEVGEAQYGPFSGQVASAAREAIRKAVLRVLKEDEFRAELIAKGHVNAAACSAERSAQLHAELYRDLMSKD